MIGLDTSAIIDIFKGKESLKKFLEENNEPLAVTTLSYLELFFGLDLKNQKHMIEAKYYKELFSEMLNLNLTMKSCEEASRIFWHLREQGKTIGQFDCVISAILIQNGINKILTSNGKHFRNIKELKVIEY